jgi:hypothetical protein
MIKGKIFFAIIIVEFFLLVVLLTHGSIRYHFQDHNLLEAKKSLVSELGLTDYAIWTEARYTRHPSQADFFSAFQDFPGAFEHFPAGAIIAPPQFLHGEVE